MIQVYEGDGRKPLTPADEAEPLWVVGLWMLCEGQLQYCGLSQEWMSATWFGGDDDSAWRGTLAEAQEYVHEMRTGSVVDRFAVCRLPCPWRKGDPYGGDLLEQP